MPRISEFFGVYIYMYFEDHLPSHFHAIYGDEEAEISTESGEIIEGSLPKRIYKLVREWTLENREELFLDWELARRKVPLRAIKPLIKK